MAFKKGDKVKHIATGKIDEVESVPGMEEYEKYGFADANKGFVPKSGGWARTEQWELVGGEKKKTTKKTEFKVGDLVKITEKGIANWGQGAEQLPKNVLAEIVRAGSDYLQVKWGSNKHNSYHKEDLKLVSKKEITEMADTRSTFERRVVEEMERRAARDRGLSPLSNAPAREMRGLENIVDPYRETITVSPIDPPIGSRIDGGRLISPPEPRAEGFQIGDFVIIKESDPTDNSLWQTTWRERRTVLRVVGLASTNYVCSPITGGETHEIDKNRLEGATLYKIGDKVKIAPSRTFSASPVPDFNWNEDGEMDVWFNRVMTIKTVELRSDGLTKYSMIEDSGRWSWANFMIVGLDADSYPKGTTKRGRKKKVVDPVVEAKVPLMDTVVISQEKKDQILEAISQKENTEMIFETWGFKEVFEKGTAISLLFYGIPGTGKTLMAQAIAEKLDMKFELIGAAEIQSSEPGGAERKIKEIFKKAGKDTVVLLDECDSLLMDRNQVGHIMSSQINTLLSEIERFEGVVIFTTNRLGRLDAALERRISGKIEFEFPDEEAREQIWKRMIPKKAPLDKDVSFKKLAKYPLTGGSIKNCVLNSARRAAYKGLSKINHASFVTAVETEIRSITEFADSKEESFTQGNYVASRDYDVVSGEGKVEIVDRFKAFMGKKGGK